MGQSNERSCGAYVTKAKTPFIIVIQANSPKPFGTIQEYKGDQNEYAAIYVKSSPLGSYQFLFLHLFDNSRLFD